MLVAVIPARGGSKRIRKKNIKYFGGKPIIAWSIEAAQKCEIFNRIIVSTDDPEIADVASCYGAEVPYQRPQELSNDYVGTTEVLAHATQYLIDQNYALSGVCCIYATAPLIQPKEIVRGWEELKCGKWEYTFSVTEYASSIYRSFKISKNGELEMIFPHYFDARSQDLQTTMHDAAQFYWGRPLAWIDGKRIFDIHSKPILIPRWRVQDIDTPGDWERAELIHKILMMNGD